MIDLSQVIDIMLGSSVVEQIANSRGDVLWSATPVVLPNYFYVEDISGAANTLSIVKDNRDGGNAPTVEIFYSTDGTNWESMGSTDTTPITATIPANGKWYLKSTNNGLTDGNDRGFTMISASGSHNIGGNVMSLIAGDNFENAQPDLQSYFKRLFKNDTALVDASALVLPTTATTACYAETFSGCTSLTTTPVLPVPTLSEYCYYCMFEYCTNLNSVTTYAQDISAYRALVNWLTGVASTGDFYNLGGATFASGVSGIPTGWTEHRANCNVSISAGSNGSVSVNGVSGDYSQSVPSGTVLTIEGTGNTGYDFDEWSDGNTTNPRTITVTGDLALTAAFESAAPAPEYFYVEDISGSPNTLSIIKEGSKIPTTEIFKSTDQTNWESMGNTDTTAITATVPANGKLYLKAVTSRLGSGYYSGTKISCTGNYNVGGYLTSLILGDDFETNTLTGKSEQTFYNLFKNSVNLISAGKLIMPTTSLRRCYCNMFYGCTALTTAPSLSQTAVVWACFSQMFQNCTSLTTAPALPATTLGIECYSSMFNGCTSLTTAPTLPATTLARECYSSMFNGCTSLTTAPTLPATTLARECYSSMFNGCTSLTQAPALPATTLANSCYKDMFRGCTSLTQAPTLPATTLVESCYESMFRECTLLTATPTFVATQVDSDSYFAMFERCTSLTTVAPLPNASRSGSPYRYMFTTCPLINSITTYFTGDYTNQGILEGWLTGVASTGDFYNLGGATFASGVSGIPTGWTEHTSL